MMRIKMILLLTFVLMITGCAGTVFAGEETAQTVEVEVYQLSDEMIDETAFKGMWVTFNDLFELWIPADWEILQLDDSARGDIFFQAVAGDGSSNNLAVSFTDSRNLSGENLDILYTQLKADPAFSSVYYADCNGIEALLFNNARVYVSGIAFFDEKGSMYTIQIGRYSDESLQSVINNLIYSLRPLRKDTEGETVPQPETDKQINSPVTDGQDADGKEDQTESREIEEET